MAKARSTRTKSTIENVYDKLAAKGLIPAADAELVSVLPERGKDKPLSLIVMRAIDSLPATTSGS